MGSSSLVWSSAAFDRWPTHRYIRVLRRAFQVIELQACLGVIALLRRDQDRKHIPVLPHLFALPSLAVTTVVGFLDFGVSLFRLSSKPFLLSMCIDAPESTTNSCSSEDVDVGAGIAWFQQESEA